MNSLVWTISVITSAILALAQFPCAQSNPSSELFTVLVEGKVGFIDRSGDMVIAPQFQGAGDFNENRAFVAVFGDKYKLGYIDKRGNFIVTPQFDAARDFSEGLAAVGVGFFGIHGDGDHEWGYVDKNGKLVIDTQFREAKNFSGGLAAVMNSAGKWGYIDTTGKLTIPFKFDDAFSFSEGLACVLLDGLFGFIDRTGSIVVEPRFSLPSLFKEGLAPVKIGDKSNKPYKFYGQYIAPDSKVIFIDKSGNTAIELDPNIKGANSFSEGLALIKVQTKKQFLNGYIDRSGRVVIEPTFSGFAGDFSEGLALVSVKEKIGFIDKSGKIAIKPAFSYGSSFRNGLAQVEDGKGAADLNAKSLYIDKTGKIIWQSSK